ncbi:MAG: hypothetical protein RIQ71_1661 [Verrucomicrobiota bacterium]|jgi:hypothetical protein
MFHSSITLTFHTWLLLFSSLLRGQGEHEGHCNEFCTLHFAFRICPYLSPRFDRPEDDPPVAQNDAEKQISSR